MIIAPTPHLIAHSVPPLIPLRLARFGLAVHRKAGTMPPEVSHADNHAVRCRSRFFSDDSRVSGWKSRQKRNHSTGNWWMPG